MYQPIEDYAVIGNLHTVALVGMNGSIDWCWLPRFDAPSIFGALLDAGKGGFFRIAPPDMPGMGHEQFYSAPCRGRFTGLCWGASRPPASSSLPYG